MISAWNRDRNTQIFQILRIINDISSARHAMYPSTNLSLTFLHEKFTRSDEIICAASSLLLLFIINQLALESNLLTTTTTNLG